MKWALIGASDIAATRLIPAMRELGHEIYGVMSSNADRAKSYATDNGIPNFTTNLDEAVNWPVGAVYISTTNELHAEQAIAAARAKKHVLCEKPLAMEIATAKKWWMLQRNVVWFLQLTTICVALAPIAKFATLFQRG